MYERLREARISNGFTCEQMANQLGLTRATYNKKERGQITMTLTDARKISEILGRTVDDLFFDDEVSKKDT